MSGNELFSVMVTAPPPPMLKAIKFKSGFAFAESIARRKVPMPVSAGELTVNVEVIFIGAERRINFVDCVKLRNAMVPSSARLPDVVSMMPFPCIPIDG